MQRKRERWISPPLPERFMVPNGGSTALASAVHATCFAASCSQMPRNFHWVASAKCRAARLRADALLKSRLSSCSSAPEAGDRPHVYSFSIFTEEVPGSAVLSGKGNRVPGDSNPHGFPHHPLKPLQSYNTLDSFCLSNGCRHAKITNSV